MRACPLCGHENVETYRFCGECATPLRAPTRPVLEERKVITSLFCDLIGFTATSESADPERAVRAGLRIAEGAEELQAVGGAPLRRTCPRSPMQQRERPQRRTDGVGRSYTT